MARRLVAHVESGQVVTAPESADEHQRCAEHIRDIVRSRRAPIMGTSERMYLEGRTSRHGFDTDEEAERCVAAAQQAGIRTHGKIYHSQLARKGLGIRDPLAWVSGMDDLATHCRAAGKTCEPLGIQGRPAETAVIPRLAEDLIEEELERRAALDESLLRSPKRLAEARAEIIERHGQRVGQEFQNAVVGDQR